MTQRHLPMLQIPSTNRERHSSQSRLSCSVEQLRQLRLLVFSNGRRSEQLGTLENTTMQDGDLDASQSASAETLVVIDFDQTGGPSANKRVA